MKSFGLSLVLVFALCSILNTHAEVKKEETIELPPITVTATRYETPIEYLSEPVDIITSQDIETANSESMYDSLRMLSGFALKRTGGPGQWSTIRMRGGASKHILLLINGVKFSDASTTSDDYGDMLSYFDPADIERIEVVKGPQSALYGSDAVSGVINIITKSPSEKPRLSLNTQGGSLKRLKGTGGISGSYQDMGYSFILSGETNGGTLEHDEFDNATFTSNLSYKLPKEGEVSLFARYLDATLNYSEWNSKYFKAFDDPRSYRYTKSLMLSLGMKQKPMDLLDYSVDLFLNRTERIYDDKEDGALDKAGEVIDYGFQSEYMGINMGANARAVLKPTEAVPALKDLGDIKAVLGVDLLDQGAEADFEDDESESIYSISPYLSLNGLLLNKSTVISLGGRLDKHSIFDAHATYKIAAAYILKLTEKHSLKLRGSYGTGFKAPSLYSLKNPDYGNEDLDPETSNSFDLGVEAKMMDGMLVASVDGFKNKFESIIAFESLFDADGNWIGGRYVNKQEADSRGAEFSVRVYPVDFVSVGAGYTYTDGNENDQPLVLVPKHNLTLNAIAYYMGFTGGLYIFRVGERIEYDYEHKVDPHTRIDLTGSYQLPLGINVFMKVQNLLNADYQESGGYDAPGISVYGGVRFGLEL
jgi:vitamin B12 transporter